MYVCMFKSAYFCFAEGPVLVYTMNVCTITYVCMYVCMYCMLSVRFHNNSGVAWKACSPYFCTSFEWSSLQVEATRSHFLLTYIYTYIHTYIHTYIQWYFIEVCNDIKPFHRKDNMSTPNKKMTNPFRYENHLWPTVRCEHLSYHVVGIYCERLIKTCIDYFFF